ncbi:hypothetical protein SAMN05444422_12210 [Halobiforma haloterrestris]|uniref:DUF7344 domain-containing protein n=1 Tax=Natronobacterium haloterrestre TaxID=148448 RepID=A0A1I1LTY2_NATHA|nr:hypothetical protein [Halobiforma haloterrestris]SFC75942.1 hypothetical protein SAMN05444422_12210 [Halobiforma haloterrestris]
MGEWSRDATELEGIEETDLSTDDLFRLLADRRVRTALVFLRDRPDTTLEQLASVIAAAEANEGETNEAGDSYDRIRHELYHSTLPALDEAGLIAFDPQSKRIRVIDVPSTIYSLFDGEADD